MRVWLLLLLVPGVAMAAPKVAGPQQWSAGAKGGVPAPQGNPPVVDPSTLMCVGMKDGMSLNWRCVDECVVHAVGAASYDGRRGEGNKTVEAYIVGGDYVCPAPNPMTEQVLGILEADARRVVANVCGEGNLVQVERFSLVPVRERAEVSATVLCKRKVAL